MLSRRIALTSCIGTLFLLCSPISHADDGEKLFAPCVACHGQTGAGDAWNTGFTLGAALMWKAAPVLALGVEVSYMRHPLDTDAYEAAPRRS